MSNESNSGRQNSFLGLNPRMTKSEYQEVLQFFELHNGNLAKCIDRYSNKIVGYLVRIESTKFPGIVYIGYHDISGKYVKNYDFEKSIAILQTLRRGDRFVSKKIKNGQNVPELSVNDLIININDITTVIGPVKDHSVFSFRNVGDIFRNTFNLSEEHNPNIYINNKGEIIEDEDIYEYMAHFEEKSKKYYKNSPTRKKFIFLPF